jgi:lipopolysaccharide/colanic/teichoic acid biosynthesis glycosyltransferase
MRRVFDILFSLIVLILTLPLSLIISIAVKLSSGGPVLFVQERVGRGEAVFRMYKFRSMHSSVVEDKSQLTVDGDTRITNVGRVIRRLKLDELPQFINVLAGDMTIVGPRPEVPRYVAEYEPWMREIFEYKPGLTDPASIQYNNESEMLTDVENREQAYVTEILPRKMSVSLEYQKNRTIFSDLKVIGATIWLILGL